jgi:lipopolysaccharide transport system permease protein/teichoic acid transport system permease protein
MRKYLRHLFERKDLIIYLVISGLKAQYKNSLLGCFWWLLDPFLNVMIYYFIVVVVFHRGGGYEYGMFLVTGMIVWRWLSSTIGSASKSIVGQSGIITQVYLPKAVFPIGAALTQLINFGFGLLVIAIFFAFFRVTPGMKAFWLPFIIMMQMYFLMAIAFPIAYICVFVRDIDNIVDHLMRLWFFGSPVIWQESMIPNKWKWLLDINPMCHFLRSYRNVLMHNSTPDYVALSWIGLTSIIILMLMIYYYSYAEYKIIKAL